MPLDVARLRDSELTTSETPEACWAALLLMLASWHQVPAASIPDDQRWMASVTGVGRRWKRLSAAVLRGWVKCSDGRLYHPEVAAYANKAWEKKCATARKTIRRLEIESGEWAQIRAAVFERDNYTCVYCGAHGVRLEADHRLPVARGGETSMENLSTACKPCNRSKGTKTVEEWRK